jgi:hypothetical protein
VRVKWHFAMLKCEKFQHLHQSVARYDFEALEHNVRTHDKIDDALQDNESVETEYKKLKKHLLNIKKRSTEYEQEVNFIFLRRRSQSKRTTINELKRAFKKAVEGNSAFN